MQVILYALSQDDDLHLLPQRVVRGRTPDEFDVDIQAIHELLHLMHLEIIQRSFVAGVDCKENTLGAIHVVAIEQRRVQRIQDRSLHTMLPAGRAHRHDGSTSVAHCGIHVTEVKVDIAVGVDGNQFRNTLGSILQDIVCPLVLCLHRNTFLLFVAASQTLVVDDQQRVHILPHLLHSAQSHDNLPPSFEGERNRHDTYRQQPHFLGYFCHERSCTRARSTAHAGRDEYHLRTVAEQRTNLFRRVLSLLETTFRLAAGTQTVRPQLQFHRHRALCQLLAVRVHHSERHVRDTFEKHIANGIAAAATDSDDLNDIHRRVLRDVEELNSAVLPFLSFLFHNILLLNNLRR